MAQLSHISHLASSLSFRLEITGRRTHIPAAFGRVHTERDLLIYSESLLTASATSAVAGRAGTR